MRKKIISIKYENSDQLYFILFYFKMRYSNLDSTKTLHHENNPV